MEDLLGIVFRSLWISGSATMLASLWSIPLAYHLSRSTGWSRYIVGVLEALIGVPTVLIGLLLYVLICSRCPLGVFGLLYTPYAIVIGESILVTPLITATSYRVLNYSWRTYGELAMSLGATDRQTMAIVLRESLSGIIASLIMGFSRAIGELGVALMVGGNIKGYTRVLTTAIALDVSRGDFTSAIILGLILVLLVVLVSISVRILRGFRGV